MTIRFDKVVPKPMIEIIGSDAVIWNKDYVFNSNYVCQISARSGVGKTTLLSIIYGLRRDYNGQVFINDLAIQKLSDKDWSDLRMKKISMVFQGLQLFENMTVMENILIKNRLTNYYQESDIIKMMESLEIDKLKDRKAGIISFGQQQRVAIIRALCQPFNLLLMDEPFSHLDAETTQSALDLVLGRVEESQSSIIVTSLSDKLLSTKFSLIKL